MRIPKNSNFSKELSKQFNRIFHKDTTFGDIQDLQGYDNPADTYLQQQVSQLEKHNGQESISSSGTIRSDNKEGKIILREVVEIEREEEGVGV